MAGRRRVFTHDSVMRERLKVAALAVACIRKEELSEPAAERAAACLTLALRAGRGVRGDVPSFLTADEVGLASSWVACSRLKRMKDAKVEQLAGLRWKVRHAERLLELASGRQLQLG